MNYWLVKSEGDCYSIDDLARDKKTSWEGIRNYQARNFMRDGMKVGDLVLFYHSITKPVGVHGIAKVVAEAHIDKSSLDPKDDHFDPLAVKYVKEGKAPLWVCPDLAFVKKFATPITLDEIKQDPHLSHMLVARTGQRLSVMPVEEAHFKLIEKKGSMK